MRRLSIIALLAVAGCAQYTGPTTPPDVVSSRGTRIFDMGVADGGFTKQTVDEMEDFEVNRMVKAGWKEAKVEAAFGGNQFVELEDGPFMAYAELADGGAATIKVDGVTNGDEMQVAVLAQDCPFYGAFRHELLHHLLLNLTGDDDGTHSRPEWASVVDVNTDLYFNCTELIGGWETR